MPKRVKLNINLANNTSVVTDSLIVPTVEEVEALQSDTSALQSDISMLQNDTSTLQNDTSALQSDVSVLQTAVGTKQDSSDIATELETRRLFRTEYVIITNVTNGTYSGDSTIWTKESASITLTADDGFGLPSNVVVAGAEYAYTNGVVTLSNPVGDVSITAVCAQPAKGDVICFDALGNGVQKKFRVIGIGEGNTVKLLGLHDVGYSVYNSSNRTIAFDNGSMYQNYESSALDIYLNDTYYNSLSASIKAAIVDEEFTQSCYYQSMVSQNPLANADFNIKSMNSTAIITYTKQTQRMVGSRHIHAIDLDEIKSYFNASTGDLIQGTAINELFFEQTTAVSKQVWCASARSNNSDYAFNINGDNGNILYGKFSYNFAVYPTFKIDLSSIDFVIKD